MIDTKNFMKQEKELEKIFYNFMKEKGYSVILHSEEDIKYMGYGGIAVKDDKFSVFFELSGNVYPRSFSVRAEDRNGNFILTGEMAALYSLSATPDMDMKELTGKFKILLNDIYEKYKVYSKENRLDFVYNELKEERKNYDDIILENQKLELEDIEPEI